MPSMFDGDSWTDDFFLPSLRDYAVGYVPVLGLASQANAFRRFATIILAYVRQ